MKIKMVSNTYRYILLILLLLCPLIIYAQDDEPTVTPSVEETVLDEARVLVEKAERVQTDSLSIANSIMTLIQVGGIFVAIVTALAVLISGLFGVSSIRELRSQLTAVRDEISSLEDLRRDLKSQIDTVQVEIKLLQQAKDDVMRTAEQLSMMNDLPELVDSRIEEQKNNAERQLQALSLVQFASQQISIGNRHAALNTLARANALQANNAVINYFHGEVLVREGQYHEGITHLEKAIAASDMPDANATLAYAYRILGDENPDQQDKYYSQSETIYLTLQEEHPDLLDLTGESVYGGLAGLYRNRNLIDKAMKIYEDIQKITPNSSYPINNLGLLHFEYDDKPFGDRNKGKEYFAIARRKASVTLRLEGTDFWRFFDIITAEIALEETPWETIKGRIDDMVELDPTHDGIQKLLNGIRQLQKSHQPPELAQQAYAYVLELLG